MYHLLPAFPVPPWYPVISELRVDVNLDQSNIDKDLDALHARLNRPGDALYKLPMLCLNHRGLTFRYREADGEHYVYVEDNQRGCLAGYVVFNRLVELSKNADPVLRAPHAKFAEDYQRLGIATAIYRWWLDAGNSLISGARQSVGANALWFKLGRDYPLFYADLRNKKLCYLGRQVDEARRQDLHTRVLMLGKGCTLQRLAAQTGMTGAVDSTRIPLSATLRASCLRWLRRLARRSKG
jgi:hypothetical protein